jgi:hypothetical protein
VPLPDTPEDDEIIVDDPAGPLDKPGGGRKKIYVDGISASIIAERVEYLDENGKLVTESLRDYTRRNILKNHASLDDFLNHWSHADRKQAIVEELETRGVLFAALSRHFLDTDVPLSIAGLSGQSNGVAHLRPEKTPDNAIAREFARLNDRAGFAGHRDLPEYTVNCGSIGGLDPLFRVRDRLFPRDRRFHLPPERVAALYLGALSSDPMARAEQCEKLRRFLARRAPRADFDALLARHAATAESPHVIVNGGRPGSAGHWTVLDTTEHGVIDIAGAAALATRLLGYDHGPVAYDHRHQGALRALTRLGRSVAAGIAGWRRRLAG